MAAVTTWLPSIVVALITGLFAYLGVVRTSKMAHDQTMLEVKHQISNLQADIKRLETKQDKHNAVIERTFKLEQKVEDLEKRI